MNDTFILLSRSILESEVFANERHLKIWIWCLCKANYKKAFVPLKIGKGITTVEVKRGQFIFGRNKAGTELNITPSTVYNDLQSMEHKGMLKIEPNNQYSLITVCNYDSYQDVGSYELTTNKQPTDSNLTTGKQQRNTTKNDNNNKNEKKEIIYPFSSSEFLEYWHKWKNYRRAEHGFKYKSEISEQTALNTLAKTANKQEHRAIQIIDYSIAQGYKGLYDLKSYDEPQTAIKFNEGTIKTGHMAGMTAL